MLRLALCVLIIFFSRSGWSALLPTEHQDAFQNAVNAGLPVLKPAPHMCVKVGRQVGDHVPWLKTMVNQEIGMQEKYGLKLTGNVDSPLEYTDVDGDEDIQIVPEDALSGDAGMQNPPRNFRIGLRTGDHMEWSVVGVSTEVEEGTSSDNRGWTKLVTTVTLAETGDPTKPLRFTGTEEEKDQHNDLIIGEQKSLDGVMRRPKRVPTSFRWLPPCCPNPWGPQYPCRECCPCELVIVFFG